MSGRSGLKPGSCALSDRWLLDRRKPGREHRGIGAGLGRSSCKRLIKRRGPTFLAALVSPQFPGAPQSNCGCQSGKVKYAAMDSVRRYRH